MPKLIVLDGTSEKNENSLQMKRFAQILVGDTKSSQIIGKCASYSLVTIHIVSMAKNTPLTLFISANCSSQKQVSEDILILDNTGLPVLVYNYLIALLTSVLAFIMYMHLAWIILIMTATWLHLCRLYLLIFYTYIPSMFELK